jgi:23S rRNA maturation mini-RNase III
MNYKQNLKKMDQVLKQLVDIEPPEEPVKVKTMVIKDLPAIDIALIGATVFSRYIKKDKSEVFTTSLYEIEKAIDSMTKSRSQTSKLEETKKRLPI